MNVQVNLVLSQTPQVNPLLNKIYRKHMSQQATNTVIVDEGSTKNTMLASQEIQPSELSDIYGKNFGIILSRLARLMNDEDEIPPTPYALTATLEILFKAYKYIPGENFPKAAVTTDDSGGLYIYWRKPGRQLQLTVPGNEHSPSYIYHTENNNETMDKNISDLTLVHWLRWFNAG